MLAIRRRYVRAPRVGGVVTSFGLRAPAWTPDWPARPGQILLVRCQQLGRVAVSVSYQMHRQIGRGRAWLTRSLTSGRLLDSARGIIFAARDASARLPAASKILWRRAEPVPTMKRVGREASAPRPSPRQVPVIDPREGASLRPGPRREAPAAGTLGSRPFYNRYDRR